MPTRAGEPVKAENTAAGPGKVGRPREGAKGGYCSRQDSVTNWPPYLASAIMIASLL